MEEPKKKKKEPFGFVHTRLSLLESVTTSSCFDFFPSSVFLGLIRERVSLTSLSEVEKQQQQQKEDEEAAKSKTHTRRQSLPLWEGKLCAYIYIYMYMWN